MSKLNRISSTLLVLVIALTTLALDCGRHREFRVYDPYYTDYHTWNDTESGYYHQWATESNRDPGRDFRKLPPDEQKEYWTWRHNHGDRDHDKDRNDHR